MNRRRTTFLESRVLDCLASSPAISYDRIAAAVGSSQRSIIYVINRLEARKMIAVERPHQARTPNQYTLKGMPHAANVDI
jgi:DNA-binding MarR family transcriptional regulator